MKNSILLVITILSLNCLVAYSKNDQKELQIGFVKDQAYIYEPNKIKPIIGFWQYLFAQSGIPYDIENYSIQRGIDLETGESFIYLLGTNKSESSKVAIRLFQKGNKIVLTEKSLEKGNIICRGVLSNCTELGQMDGYWICGTLCSEECLKLTSIYIDDKGEVSLKSFLKEFGK